MNTATNVISSEQPKRVRLKDIAAAANISVTAASMALANHPGIGSDTRQRVHQISVAMNYQPRTRRRMETSGESGAVGTQSLRRVGFMVLGDALESWSYTAMLRTLMIDCTARNIVLNIGAVDAQDESQSTPSFQRVLNMARDGGGLLLTGLIKHDLINALHASRIPFVVVGAIQDIEDASTHRVGTDEIEMGRRATESLLRAGHRRVAFVTDWIPQGLSHWRWRIGYAAAHLDANLPVDPALIRVIGPPHGNPKLLAEAVLAIPQRPTAFVVPDVRIGVGLLGALRDLGVTIPPNAVVVAGDPSSADTFHAAAFPRINYPFAELASTALSQLERVYERPETPPATVHIPFTASNLPTENTGSR